jgi:hypothetical protein
MRPSAASAAAAHRRSHHEPILSPRLLLVVTLALLPNILEVEAAPARLPHVLGASPFAHRLQAEANIVRLACTLLLPQRAPARHLSALVLRDISGGLEYSLRQFCGDDSDKSPGINVQVAGFSSRVALRTWLMLQHLSQHLSQPPLSSRRATRLPLHTLVPVGSCCQPSSDLDELSFSASNCECPVARVTVS